MSDANHAKLSASGAHRWANCPASYHMERELPDTSSVYAERGHFLHKIAYDLLVTQGLPLFKNYSLEGLTPEEIHAVKSYVDFINQQKGQRYLEQTVYFSDFVPEGFGTADAIILDNNTLKVIDFKTGRGIKVAAKDNYQLILYALGALQLASNKDYKIDMVELTIHQNIIGHIDHWQTTPRELYQFGERIQQAALKALDDSKLIFNPAEATCHFCKAKATCKPLMQYSTEMVTQGFRNVLLEPHTLTNDDLSKVLSKLSALESWIAAVRKIAHDKLMQDENIPGFKLTTGRKSRSWEDPEAVEALLRKKGWRVKDLYPRKFISVAQAEKLLAHKKHLIQDFIRVSTGKPIIAKDTCDKQAYLECILEGFEAVA